MSLFFILTYSLLQVLFMHKVRIASCASGLWYQKNTEGKPEDFDICNAKFCLAFWIQKDFFPIKAICILWLLQHKKERKTHTNFSRTSAPWNTAFVHWNLDLILILRDCFFAPPFLTQAHTHSQILMESPCALGGWIPPYAIHALAGCTPTDCPAFSLAACLSWGSRPNAEVA